MLEKIIDAISIAIILRAILFGGIATAVACFIRCAFILPLIRHKLWDKAGKAGHHVTAQLKRSRYVTENLHNNRDHGTWHFIYHFTYHGRTYRYRANKLRCDAPRELDLRFLRYPWNARPMESFTGFEWDFVFLWFPVLTLTSLVLILVASV